MNSNSSIHSLEQAPSTPAITGIAIAEGARAMLVYHPIINLDGDEGPLLAKPVAHDQSVLNIERDLCKHLDTMQVTTEWLRMLRDYCDRKLTACAH
jgi:hypothetical protein